MAPRDLAVGRMLGALVAGVAIVVAALSGLENAHWNAAFDEWQVARPMTTPIDLSCPGKAEVPFRQTCSCSHGEALCLEGELGGASGDPAKALAGLSGTVVVADAAGMEVARVELKAADFQMRNGVVELTYLSSFGVGDYTAAISIASGAPAQVGRRPTLYARYALCGLERFPALIFGALATGAGIVGLLCAVAFLPGFFRYGLRRAPTLET